MKRNYTLLLFLLATVSTLAQTPEKMSYQAVLRDASNALLTNQEVGMQISILQTTITGTAVYIETQTATTNINGLVSLEIGSGTSSDDFNTIDWSAGPYFIKTETDPTGGSSYSITGTSQIMSVPFALYAKTSGSSETNTTNIDNNTAVIALNTAKVGYAEALVSANTAVAANTAKVGYTEALVSANTDVAANTVKVGYTEALVSANTDVAANTVKVGYTEALVSANTDVAANTVKVGYTVALVSANTDVTANTVKVGYTEALVSANTDVAANTVKVGYTEAAVSANTDVAANTVKVGYTEALVSANTDVAANTVKVGYTEALVSANTDVAANTSKVGITEDQATAITDNTAKDGITAAQATAIAANTLKVGITEDQASEITANTLKVDTDATSVNAAGALMDLELTDLPGIKAVTIANLQVIPSEGAFVDGDKTKLDGIEDLIEAFQVANTAVAANTSKVGYTEVLVSANTDVAANTLKVDTDATSVNAAGALMDSELTDLEGIKAVTIANLQAKLTEGAFVDGDKTKLDGIEASADVTDAANVNAAGALMDSELTDLPGIKAVTIANLQVIPSEGAFADGDKTKLDGIEALIASLEAQVAALEAQTPTAEIGDFRAGGVVFWVDPTDNRHGLVCAIEDQSAAIQWYNGSNTTTGATGTAIGTGSANTTAIIADQGDVETAYAAGLARAYRDVASPGWFLPSKDELNQMYLNKATINSTAAANGGSNFSINKYWSSTEYDESEFAWVQNFYTNFQSASRKSNTNVVRAVRAF
jgi:hypothetical protein